MKFINKTDKELITKAIAIAEAHLTPDSYIMISVANKNDWKYGVKETGKEIVKKLCENPVTPVSVFTYKPWYRWSKAIGYFDGKSIYINSYRMSSDPHDIAKNLAHEYCHFKGYNHASNYPSKDKDQFSIPYFVSSNL
jgi:hypothetical protein